MTKRAVILAAGRGTRMRRPATGVILTPQQERTARTGLKAMIPIAGRPFLDRLVAALAATGIGEICVVVGVRHRPLADHCRTLERPGLEITTAVQRRPLGTAHALLAAAEFAGRRPFLMLNSDNYYAPADLRSLAALSGPGLLVVERRQALAAGASEEKLRRWAVVERDNRGCLAGLIEKPDVEAWRALADPVLLSTNAWRFEVDVFDACRRIGPSPRGELELPAAVGASIAETPGRCYRVLVAGEPVLDLSERADVEALERFWSRADPDPVGP